MKVPIILADGAGKYGPYTSFFENLEEMKKTHLAKNADYAGDGGTYYNFIVAAYLAQQFNNPVDKVFATVLGIKLARLAVLKRPGKKPKNESILDTQKDLATYATIWWTYYCEEVEREHRGRVCTRVRKRVSKTSRSGGSSSKRRGKTAKTPRRANRKGTRRPVSSPQLFKR